MKIYYLDDIPTPYRIGVFKKLSEKLPQEFKVGFCAKAEPGRTWELAIDGFDHEFLSGFQFRPPFQMNPFSFKVNFSVLKALRIYKPDVVVMSGYTHPTVFLVALYCIVKKIPFGVASETNEHCSATNGIRWFIKKLITFPIISKMSFGLPTGSQSENYFKKLGCKNIPYGHFPNTPDITPIDNMRSKLSNENERKVIKEKYGITGEGPIILFVGRLILAKNPMELVNAYAEVMKTINTEASLVIVGAGDEEDKIAEFVNNTKNTKLIPWLDNPENVYELMCLADIFVLPSIHEPWGAVINEAMAAGCCTVVSDKVGSAYDMIKNDDSGFMYKSGDVNKLIEILTTLIENPQKRKTMSDRALESAKHFNQDYARDGLINAVEKISSNVSH